MINEKEFYRDLANVPAMPAGLYDAVERETGRPPAFLRPLLAVAAALIVTVGVTAGLMSRPAGDSWSPELADELQSVSEYLSGTDLDKEMATLVMYEQ